MERVVKELVAMRQAFTISNSDRNTSYLPLRVRPAYHVADHLVLNIMAGVPGGASNERDTFGVSRADAWGLVAYQTTSTFTVGELAGWRTRLQPFYSCG